MHDKIDYLAQAIADFTECGLARFAIIRLQTAPAV